MKFKIAFSYKSSVGALYLLTRLNIHLHKRKKLIHIDCVQQVINKNMANNESSY